eukprot:3732187-Pyramimonas_sp.AAC.1
MSFVTKLFKSKPVEEQPPRSLLADWNDYSAGDASSPASDIEAGVGKLFGSVKDNTSGLVGSISRTASGLARTTSKTVTMIRFDHALTWPNHFSRLDFVHAQHTLAQAALLFCGAFWSWSVPTVSRHNGRPPSCRGVPYQVRCIVRAPLPCL